MEYALRPVGKRTAATVRIAACPRCWLLFTHSGIAVSTRLCMYRVESVGWQRTRDERPDGHGGAGRRSARWIFFTRWSGRQAVCPRLPL